MTESPQEREAPEVLIYTKDDCSRCDLVKKRLASKGVPFTERDFPSQPPEVQDRLKRDVGMNAPLVITQHFGSFSGIDTTIMRNLVNAYRPDRAAAPELPPRGPSSATPHAVP